MSRALWLLLLAIPVYGQIAEPVYCRAHGGDNPQWAQPGYDDGTWPTLSLEHVEFPHRRIFWVRCRLDLGALKNSAPLYLQAVYPTSYTIYLDGHAVVSASDGPTQFIPLPKMVGRSSVVLAMRTVDDRVSDYPSDIEVGSRNAVVGERAKRILQAVSAICFGSAVSPVLLAAGLMLILLSGSDPQRRETLWFGIFALSFGLLRSGNLLGALELPGIGWALETIWIAGNAAMSLVLPRCFYSLTGKPLPLIFGMTSVLSAAWSTLSALSLRIPSESLWRVTQSPAIRSFGLILLTINVFSAATAFWPWRKIERRNWPVFLTSMVFLFAFVFQLAVQLPFAPSLGADQFFPVQLSSLAVLLSLLVFAVLLSFRLQRVRREHDELAQEMQAAQAIQRLLVPSEVPRLPGFTVQAAYVPAREVGGDFYQLLPQSDGSLLLVVGDVSGKGLDAAMLGATIIGALSTITNPAPSAVLRLLNRAIQNRVRGGFVTCCCTLFRPNGMVEIANAGHLMPYAEGEEIQLESGPPLGLELEAEYRITTMIQDGRTFTFLSDGVLEARNGQREMLGFDRLQALTVRSAREIAKAAQTWGQEDDITVVQIAYA